MGLLIKYMIVNFNLVLNWQNSSGFSFSELFQHAEKVVSPYNTFIFSVAIIIMAVLFFIDWKMNQGKDHSKNVGKQNK